MYARPGSGLSARRRQQEAQVALVERERAKDNRRRMLAFAATLRKDQPATVTKEEPVIAAFHLHVGIDLDDIPAAQTAVLAMTEGAYCLEFGQNMHDGSHDGWNTRCEPLGTTNNNERTSHGIVYIDDPDEALAQEVAERIVRALRPWLQPEVGTHHDGLLAELTAGEDWTVEYARWFR